MDSQHDYTPIEEPYKVPIDWKFSSKEYAKLAKGNGSSRSIWRCFMKDNIFHIYKGFKGGLEWYRFMLNKNADNSYNVICIEALRKPDSDEILLKFLDSPSQLIKTTIGSYGSSTISEVFALLDDEFDIKPKST